MMIIMSNTHITRAIFLDGIAAAKWLAIFALYSVARCWLGDDIFWLSLHSKRFDEMPSLRLLLRDTAS